MVDNAVKNDQQKNELQKMEQARKVEQLRIMRDEQVSYELTRKQMLTR